MAHRPNFTAQLTDIDACRKAAKDAICVQTRGSQVGQGSIRDMLEEIAAGRLVVIRHGMTTPVELTASIHRLRQLAHKADLESTVITALADALASLSLVL